MEIVLLSITVVSLLFAIGMAAVAWHVSRQERARSAARVAALAAAAEAPESPGRPSHAVEAERELIAVNDSRVAAARPAIRLSPVAAAVRPAMAPARTETADYMRPSASAPSFGVEDSPAPAAPLDNEFLGSALAIPASSSRQRGLAVAALILFAALLAGGYWTVFGDRSLNPVIAADTTQAPLELISLRHERRGGRLAVTGLVRNPIAGAPVEKLAAVVFLFDQNGGFLASARADVDFLKLAPGDESPFVIAVDAPANVARYRVSFRNDAGIVPHIDRRGQEPVATTADTQAIR